MVGSNLKLYSFVDNHDVERIYTKLKNKAHFLPVHVMLYTLPGVPSIYYGSEFGMEGKKERYSDDSLRPELKYEDYKDAVNTNSYTKLIAALGKIHQNTPALCYGDYKQLELQNTRFAYARTLDGKSVIITVNNGDDDAYMNLECGNSAEYTGALSGEKVSVNGGRIQVKVPANSGEIWIPTELCDDSFEPAKSVEIKMPEVVEAVKNEEVTETAKNEEVAETAENVEAAETVEVSNVAGGPEMVEISKFTESVEAVEAENAEAVNDETVTVQDEKEPEKVVVDWNKPYEDMSVEELQEVILEKMRRNGPVTDYMLGTVRENTHHGSLVSWARSFN